MPRLEWPGAVERDAQWLAAVLARALPAGITHWPLDSRYWLPTLEDFDKLLQWDWTDQWEYTVDRFDCENYSIRTMTAFNALGLNCVGLVLDWSSGHAYNLVVLEDGSFRWLEPQDDAYVTLGSGLYKLTSGVVLL